MSDGQRHFFYLERISYDSRLAMTLKWIITPIYSHSAAGHLHTPHHHEHVIQKWTTGLSELKKCPTSKTCTSPSALTSFPVKMHLSMWGTALMYMSRSRESLFITLNRHNWVASSKKIMSLRKRLQNLHFECREDIYVPENFSISFKLTHTHEGGGGDRLCIGRDVAYCFNENIMWLKVDLLSPCQDRLNI